MTHPCARIVLEGQRQLLARNLVLPPLGLALAWLVHDGLREGRIPILTWIAAGPVIGLVALGGIASFLPDRLSFDDGGLHWSRWGRTRSFKWSDVEEIGVARTRGMEGWDTSVVRALTRNESGRLRAEPMIGLNVSAAVSTYQDAVMRAYKRGFTGYEVNIPNSFGQPVEQIVEELRTRWQRSRIAASVG